MPDIIAASCRRTLAKSEAQPIRRTLRLSCLLLTLLAACAAPPPPDPEEEALLRDFRSLAFQTERPVLGNDGRPRPRRDHLAKWTVPVRFALVDGDSEDLRAPPPSFRRLAEAHLEDLAGLTGLEVAPAPLSRANLLIFLAKDPFAAARRHRGLFAHKIADRPSYEALLREMERTATCFGFLWGGWPSGRSIDFAVAFIRADRGARTIEGCLVQEVTQVLGPMNDLAPTADSVFSDSGRQVALTARDRLLIRMLYDGRLRPGMGWAEVEPLARAALRELRRGG
ncbi:DUF2927 domain-containing protein [Pelagibius sp.]|uniref:DUF2927 domain-containing protein n=1 Tax=Pelagibius sp. TaxID=1931238 RepID=UPI003B514AF5